jgi:hypothetical protein
MNHKRIRLRKCDLRLCSRIPERVVRNDEAWGSNPHTSTFLWESCSFAAQAERKFARRNIKFCIMQNPFKTGDIVLTKLKGKEIQAAVSKVKSQRSQRRRPPPSVPSPFGIVQAPLSLF